MADVTTPTAAAAVPDATPGKASTTPAAAAKPAPAAPAATTEDADEAEYQARMAELRGVPEADDDQPDDEEPAGEDGEDEDEERQPKKKKAETKKFKLKVNGSEEEVDEAEVVRRAQLYSAGDKKFEKAAKIERQARGLIESLKANPFQVLAHPAFMGEDAARAAAEKWLFGKVQFEGMSPEEQQRHRDNEELERFRSDESDKRQREDAEKREAMREHTRQVMSKRFVEALATGGVPKNDWTVMRMAQYMAVAKQKGITNVVPADVVSYVKRDWLSSVNQMVGTMDGDTLIETLGEDAAKKMTKAQVKRYRERRAAGGGAASPAPGRAPAPAAKPVTYSSMEEMQEAIRNRR